jgi:hypothetical protein
MSWWRSASNAPAFSLPRLNLSYRQHSPYQCFLLLPSMAMRSILDCFNRFPVDQSLVALVDIANALIVAKVDRLSTGQVSPDQGEVITFVGRNQLGGYNLFASTRGEPRAVRDDMAIGNHRPLHFANSTR